MDINYQIPRAALLWILVSVVLVIIPQSIRMPFWLSAVALLCVGWRLLIFSGRLDYPGKAMRVAVVVFTLIISVSQMRNLGVGLESASSLLTLGFVFKLIEMRYKRDIYVVICLSFLMCMVAFLYSQSVLVTIYIAFCVMVIIGAMIALNRSTLQADHRSTWRMAMRIAAQAVPLTIVLFLVFPRIAPLWAVPVQTSAGRTGVSDEMSPGDLSALGRSNELAFRVQFENGPPPLHEDLYWRGLVLENFDGETWTRRRGRSAYSGAAEYANFQFTWRDRVRLGGEPLTYNVIQEPTQQPWIYGLHLAEPLSRNIYQSRNFEAFNNGLIAKRISYDMQSYMSSQTDLILLDSARRRNLDVPQQGNERSREFAQQLRSSVNSDRDYVNAVLSHFQQNPFYYTLNPELLGDNRIDDFLFNTRQGFCEHYASTFGFLMRAAGVPTRVVVGYQGAEYNRFEDYMMVYQYNAHAWNEVWLEGEGWVRFDPTAAVSPTRIRLGVEAALQDDPGFLDESLLAAVGRFNWVNTLRLRLDAIEYEWNRRVVNYDEEVQFELFERLFGEVTQQKAMLLLIALASIVILGVGMTIIRIEPRGQQDPVVRLYNRISDELAKVGLERRKGEGPLSYRDRVVASKPELATVMAELTDLYVQISYRNQAADSGVDRQQFAALQSCFRQLKSVLSPLRQRLS
ncbi:MAG: DUF3488 and transglutaminase-like domain-containing protein [Pseudomonadales bacterium]|nr:DUF3488 and transglutaminase-like domain-containing protein [Pseudomonadales bacterium]